MVKRLRHSDASNERPIRLNVGGRMFDVSMDTINSFQYLQARLSDNFQSSFDEAGHIFVDRCPELFEVLLQSIRSMTRPRQRYIVEWKRDLLTECKFSDMFASTCTAHEKHASLIMFYVHISAPMLSLSWYAVP
jgi:hypothetical protein